LVVVNGNTVTLQCPVKLKEYLNGQLGSVGGAQTVTLNGSFGTRALDSPVVHTIKDHR
jgi:hypothetical protein